MDTVGKRISLDLAVTSTERLEALKREIETELTRRNTPDPFDLATLLWGDLGKRAPRRSARATKPATA